MNWPDLLKSAVLAAVVTAVVALIASFVSSWTALRINKGRLNLDKELANQRAKAELELAAHRAELDRKLGMAKRRAEVAEKVLTDFYKAKRAFDVIRSPMIWAREMIAEEGVADDVVTNDGYGVMRRFRQYADLFSELEATRYSFGALFGSDATAPYDSLVRVHNRVFHAAEALLQYRHQQDAPNLQGHLRNMRREAFSKGALDDEGNEMPDRVASDITAILTAIEASCRPALQDPLVNQGSGSALLTIGSPT